MSTASRTKRGEAASGALPLPADVIAAAESRLEGLRGDRGLSFGVETFGTLLQENPPERIRARLRRLGMAAEAAAASAERVLSRDAGVAGVEAMPSYSIIPEETAADVVPVLERILGTNDLIGVSFLEVGGLRSRAVGRVVIRDDRGRTVGFGTGFLVSPRLLMTNNHVLGDARAARNSRVEFNFQNAPDGSPLPPVAFDLDPAAFFATDKPLDFALVAVKPRSGDAVLAGFGFNVLSGEPGDVLTGEFVNIIQHPNGEPKQLALRENQVIGISQDRFLHYRTDTAPGSSGSPVFNDQWELVALHHAGVPEKDAQGRVLAIGGGLWKPSMGEHRVSWVANEGVRVASLLEHLRALRPDGDAKRLLGEALDGATAPPPSPRRREEADRPSPAADGAKDAATTNGRPADGGTASVTSAILTARLSDGAVVLTVPLEVTIRLGTPSAGSASDGAGRADGGAVPGEAEAVSIDPDYGNRRGYDPGFLGAGGKRVPLPKLSDEMLANASVNKKARGADKHVLPYHHFSVVMNRARRLAYFTAVNVDGEVHYRIKRETDKWYFDPRIAKADQVGNELYADNPLDRGHLVRRLDPAWGPSKDAAKVANDDTFHFTNCTPQHSNFNQNASTWAGLEDYVLDHADTDGVRVSVFTGPVFRDDDPEYEGVRLPREYWKVVAMLKGGKLASAAFVLSQADLLADLERASFDHTLFQKPVTEVAELTGLDFGPLADADVFGTAAPFEARAAGGVEIRSLEDVQI